MAELDPGDTPTIRNDGLPSPLDETLRASSFRSSPVDPRDAEGRPFGRYRLVSELGRGGMGVVWKAWDTQLRREVALKTIRGEVGEEQARRFLREAQLAAKLRHPGIVAVHDVGVEGGEHYYTADFVAGRSLDAALREGVAVRQAVAWVVEVAEALHHAHQQGVVHRDVKPGNILLDQHGRTCVTDFGLAKEVDLSSGPALTASGALVGTPQYMSPEQASGLTEALGPPSDQFSLGVVLYEAIVGRPPFQAKGLRELLNAITDVDPARPSQANPRVQRDLETVCLKALEKDPLARYASMADLAADLRSWLDGEPIRARPASMAYRWSRKARKHKGIVALVVVNLAVGGWAGIQALSDRGVVQERDAAQEALRKAELVDRVFGRWRAIGRTLREIEARCVDDSLSDAERKRVGDELWPGVEAFMRDTPGDPTSQAAMKALAGWARAMAGDPEQGFAWMREATRLDADLPHGALMEALALLAEYMHALRPPEVSITSEGPRVEAPQPESDEARASLSAVAPLLESASRAGLRGQGIGNDLRSLALAFQAIHEGKCEDAERGLTTALGAPALEPFRTEILFSRGVARCLLGRFGEAVPDLEEAAAARPRHMRAWLSIGFARMGEGAVRAARGESPSASYEAAVRACDQAIAVAPRGAEAFHVRGLAHSALGDAAAAIADYDAGLALSPGDAALLLNRGAARHRAGDFQGALADAEAALAASPGEALALHNRALALAELGRRAEALAVLDDLVRREPGHVTALLDRSRIRLISGDADGCVADAEAVLALRPGHAGGLSRRGNGRLAKGDLDGAQGDFEAALAVQPRDVEALWGRGSVRAARGDIEGGIADLGAAIGYAPENADLRYTRGGFLYKHGDYDLALADYDEYLRVRPGDHVAHLRRAQVYEAKGDLAGTVADMEQVLASAPADWSAREEVRSYVQQGHYNLACELTLRAASAGPQEAAALRDGAFRHLEASMAAGYSDWERLGTDADLAPLHDDPRWEPLIDRGGNR